MVQPAKPTLDSISDKVVSDERLTFDDGLFLYSNEMPLGELAVLANLVRERKNGNAAYFNINTHLNPTNVCIY
ncbi:MAG: aminofutalosine synthase MqnE, partial [Pirellulales bacterium]